MHGLDRNVDLSFLIGKEITQLSLGLYEFQIRFSGEIMLSIHGSVLYECDGVVETIHADKIKEAASLVGIVGKIVSKLDVVGEGDLILRFGEVESLVVCDSNRDFESYVLWHNGNFIAV